MNLELKQEQFNSAMKLYDQKSRYKLLGKLVSVINVSLEIFLFFRVVQFSIGLTGQIFSLFIAYFITDFWNGLVHLYMDNNDNYDSIWGPLIAAFHLHHKTPRYKDNNVVVVYFNESGSKLWLVFYLTSAVFLLSKPGINPFFAYVIVYAGILSSVAEVSHYLAHNRPSGLVNVFRRIGLLLSARHHSKHHLEDNVSYAFLNGFTDTLINMIAKKYFTGYKNTTDLHYAHYSGSGTENRG